MLQHLGAGGYAKSVGACFDECTSFLRGMNAAGCLDLQAVADSLLHELDVSYSCSAG